MEAPLGDLVKQGKVSAVEARTLAEKIAQEGKAEYETLSQQLGDKVRELLARDTAKLESRLAAVEQRLAALEEKAAGRVRKS